MKKTLVLAVMAFCMTTILHAKEYNMFNPADCDAEGWLWFNSQAVVNKYVGIINEDEGAVNPTGALIQMVYADIAPDYPATTVDPNIMGYGTDGELGSEGAIKGAIILPPSSAMGNFNGGAVIVRMPSCSTFSVCLSSGKKVDMKLFASTDPKLEKFGLIIGSAAPFKPFARIGVSKVTGLEQKTNANTGNSFKSETPKYAMLRNGTKDTLFIHSFKITTPKQEDTGIHEMGVDNHSTAEVYTMDGLLIASKIPTSQLSELKKGLYMVRSGKNVRKMIVK